MDLTAKSDGELGRHYNNCRNAILKDKPNRREAETRIEEIKAVWAARLGAAAVGEYKAESPETGMLKTVGYQVGRSGLKTQKRWQILDTVMTGLLPFVGSPAHMLEWGGPLSLTRYRKLHRVIASFRTRARHRDEDAKSFDDWSEDLDYIEREWKPKVR